MWPELQRVSDLGTHSSHFCLLPLQENMYFLGEGGLTPPTGALTEKYRPSRRDRIQYSVTKEIEYSLVLGVCIT